MCRGGRGHVRVCGGTGGQAARVEALRNVLCLGGGVLLLWILGAVVTVVNSKRI